MKIFCRSLVILLCMFVTAGCADLLDPNVDERETSVGANYSTVYDLLELQGGYAYFLEAVDLTADATGYQKKMQGASLVTLFAPSDDVFGTYLKSQYGVESVAEMYERYPDELAVLVGYHMVQYSWRPIDFLAFSVYGNAVVPQEGDGSCYKYLTFARDDIESVVDTDGYTYSVFSRERYLPVMSSRLWETRGFTEAEAQYNYEMLFPSVYWQGMDDQLYVGSAAVTEAGIPALNGYLYLIDNVAGALDNIYNELHKDWAAEYTLFTALCERVNYFEYSSDYTDTYATFGDSIFFQYSWTTPTTGAVNDELPEYGSDWSYHFSDVFDRKLRYTVHCFVPTDRYLEPYLTSQFSSYYVGSGTSGDAEFIISQLPRNVVFHLLRAMSFDKQDIVFPTELSKGIKGYNGEVHTIDQSLIQDVKMCTNGIIYGLDTLIVSNVFNSVISELMSTSDYQYYANALTYTGIYEQAANPANEYTIFAQTDYNLLENSGIFWYEDKDEELAFGEYLFYDGTTAQTSSTIGSLINNNLIYGEVEGIIPVYNNGTESDPDPSVDYSRRRYYRTVGWTSSGLYVYTANGSVFDEKGDSLLISETYDSGVDGNNGKTYIVDRFLSSAESSGSQLIKANGDLSLFVEMLNKVGLSNLTFLDNSMMFIPPDTCLWTAIELGYIPNVSLETSTYGADSIVYNLTEDINAVQDLTDYLRYYFVSTSTNNLASYILPGLGGSGVTSEESFSHKLLTQISYIASNQMEYVTVSWSDENPDILTLTDNSGNEINTSSEVYPQFGTNALMYVIEGCFDYNNMYQYK